MGGLVGGWHAAAVLLGRDRGAAANGTPKDTDSRPLSTAMGASRPCGKEAARERASGTSARLLIRATNCRRPTLEARHILEGYQWVAGALRGSLGRLLACLVRPHPLSGCVPCLRPARASLRTSLGAPKARALEMTTPAPN